MASECMRGFSHESQSEAGPQSRPEPTPGSVPEAAPAGEKVVEAMDVSAQWKARLLQSLVPVRVLTEDHLSALLRDTAPEAMFKGQLLTARGSCDGQHLYLLSGAVSLRDADGSERVIDAADAESCYPLAHCQPREQDVTATEDGYLIRIDSDRLDAMLAWDQAANCIALDIAGERALDEDADWMLTLLRSRLFYKVPPMNIRQILDRFEPQYLSSGDVVIRQGELGDCCYVIKEGSADVYQAADERGKPVRVATLEVGHCFGEDALVNQAARNATVIMRENGVLMRLAKQDFYLLLKPPAVQRVDIREFRAGHDGGGVVVDVRSQDEFEQGHWPGAVNIPLNLLYLKARLLSAERPCLIYCNSGRRSVAATSLLTEKGYQVQVLRDGFEGLSAQDREGFCASQPEAAALRRGDRDCAS